MNLSVTRMVGVIAINRAYFKISLLSLFLLGLHFDYVKAASLNQQQTKTSRQPQAAGAAKNAKLEDKAASTSAQATAKTSVNNQTSANSQHAGQVNGQASGLSNAEVVSVNDEDFSEKGKKKNKKRDATDEDKADEPIEFNDQKGILAGLDYPELQVVPRASERLALEAQEEKTRLISPYWPVQLSAMSVIVAGFMSNGKYKNDSSDAAKNSAEKSGNAFASQLAIFTGGLWLGTTYYMSHYLSYGEALQEIRKINGKDKKSTLLRERLAEEAIERPARVTYLVNTLSVWSTLFSSLYLAGHTTQLSPNYAAISAAMAFIPWLIDSRITRNWEKHQEYKRKIYAPLTMGTWEYDMPTQEWRPQLTLNWTF